MRDNLADLKVKLRSIDALLPHVRNPRTHSEAQIAQIAASMVEFGWTNAILVDGHNGVIAGHGRLLAARKLGLKQVPVVELAHLSETQKRAYVIADNQLSLASAWDQELLRVELEALREDDFDLGLIGFDPDELAKLLEGEEPDHEGLTDDDAIPEPPDEAVTRRGDLWILGDHRLLCGDSGNGEEVDRLLDGRRSTSSTPIHRTTSRSSRAQTTPSRRGSRRSRPPIRSRHAMRAACIIRASRGRGERPRPSGPPGSCARRTGPSKTTSFQRRTSPPCSWRGSETWRACWSRAEAFTSGAAIRTSRITRRC